jgi:uncharacterized protein YdhG (YjbR/CyaY superfamily)
MKKVQSGKRRRAAKGRSAPKGVEGYLAGVPEAARGNFDKLRAAVRSAVPKEATETISYGIPAIQHNGILVWFAAFSSHCSLFPTASVIEASASDLEGFTTSKGTVQFPTGRPLPVALVKKLVKARVREHLAKKRG